ncbi:reverse transcriptase domain-containing protein, partial [Escherichia coli]|uniref:reverse transcriptase domain-containing protein n=1 Tax=Escherichia coli TaxID=562 RepID=UPI0028E04F5A
VCYLDDILVWGKTQAEHDASLVEVLTCIANSGMKLNDKCLFSAKELDFLGHRISAEGISPLESKVKAIVHAPAPTDIK